MCDRVYNFAAGPCMLPFEVLNEAKHDLLNYKQSGMSVMEMSHRSKTYDSIHQQCLQDIRQLLKVPSTYDVLLMPGGGTAQFAAVPLNLTTCESDSVGYVTTGTWSAKAAAEAKKFASVADVWCDKKASAAPSRVLADGCKYVYYCANETISGLEFREAPEVIGGGQLVSDMSSNFCTKPVDVSKHGVIFAGVQKNVGPAGLGIVIASHDIVVGPKHKTCPAILDYKNFADTGSLYNTPPCWNVYVTGLTLAYLRRSGGLDCWAERSAVKAQVLHDIIDGSDGFYKCPIDKASRSRCNVAFTCRTPELDALFVQKAKERHGFENLKGHRSVGGIRASVYNGMPMEGVEALAKFMRDFRDEYSDENVQ